MGFDGNLKKFLNSALEAKVVNEEAVKAILDFHAMGKKPRNFSVISAVLGGLGGLAVFLGVVLVISANWFEIPVYAKIGAFILLLVSVHAVGIYLGVTRPELEKTRNAFHLTGAGLVLAGIGLYAQTFKQSSSARGAFLLWFAAILPLALIVRTPSLSLMSAAAFTIWYHIYVLRAAGSGGSETYFLLTESALAGVFFITDAALARFDPEGRRGPWLPIAGTLIFAAVYGALGFAHRMAEVGRYSLAPSLGVPEAFVLITLIGSFTVAAYELAEQKTLRIKSLGALLLAVMVFFASTPAYVPFGGFFIAAAAWCLWFAGGFWLVFYGVKSERNGVLNAGVWLIGLGIILRFIDLASSMLRTGLSFIAFGAVLIALCFMVESVRRKIVKKLSVKRP